MEGPLRRQGGPVPRELRRGARAVAARRRCCVLPGRVLDPCCCYYICVGVGVGVGGEEMIGGLSRDAFPSVQFFFVE